MIHFFAILSLLLCGVCYTGFQKEEYKGKFQNITRFVWIIFGAALLLRLILAYTTHGFGNDIACFAAWADRIFTVGPGAFYSAETFTDYPPGFMYVLYLIGALRSLLGIPYYSSLHIMLLKLPAILCDMVCGYLLYKEATTRLHFSEMQSVCVACAYLFQPAIILNSSCWGQVDSVHTLVVILMCLFLMDGKMLPAYAIYGIGVLLKPQTLIFTPVLLVGILDHVFLQDFSWRKFSYNLCGGLAVICGMLLLCVPFGLDAATSQYTSTLGSYEYAAVNAYNFWGLLGMNWVDQNTIFLFLPCRTWGSIAIVLIVAVLALAAWKFLGKNGDSIDAELAQTKVTYQVKVEGVAPELYDNCLKHLPSPLMASGALVGGQIEAVEKLDYQVLDANGNWVTDPDHVTLIFTVTTTTPTAEVMTTKVGDQEVRIGKTDYILKSEYIEFSGGTITDVNWEN